MLKITTRSRQAGLTAALHWISYVLEDSGQVTHPPTATDVRAIRSTTEVTDFSYTELLMWPKRSPYMIGTVILQTNESGPHDLSSAVHRLRRDVDERQSCYVEKPRHAGTR